jgi:hypothetical protein
MFKNPLKPEEVKKTDTASSVHLEPTKSSIVKNSHIPKDMKKFADAIKKGKEVIDSGKTKMEAALAIYPLICNEEKEVIHRALIEGCRLTEKGAITYRYNLIRKTAKKP